MSIGTTSESTQPDPVPGMELALNGYLEVDGWLDESYHIRMASRGKGNLKQILKDDEGWG